MSDQSIVLTIPKDLISTKWGEMIGLPAIKLILSRFRWVTDTRLRFINNGNMDCIFEMTGEPAQLKLLSAVKVDNLFENTSKIDSPHLLFDQAELEPRDVL